MHSTLSDIRKATEEQLNRQIEVHAVACPEHFKRTPYVTTLAWTAINAYPGLKDVLQVGPYLDYIRYAYGLNKFEPLGVANEEESYDYIYLLLHIDYQQQYIEVSIVEFGGSYCVRDRFSRVDNFGGNTMSSSV